MVRANLLFESYSQSILRFIEQSPEWAFFIVLGITFLESLAFIGVLMPGWLLLVGVGALVGSQVLGFYPIVLAMLIGAVLGEGLSYYLGYHYREKIRQWRWIESHQKGLERADRFIAQYGAMSLVIGRFIGPVRAVLPVVAGVSGMRQGYFWFINVSSGLLWAPLYLLPGVLVGAAINLPEGSQEVLAVAAIGELMLLWLARRWWIQSNKIENNDQSRLLRFRVIMAIICGLLLLLIVLMSEVGQALINTLARVLSVVM